MAGMDLGYLPIPIKTKTLQNKILPLIIGNFYLLLKQKVGENDFCVGSLHFTKNEMVAKLSPVEALKFPFGFLFRNM